MATDISTALPALDLEAGSTLTVDTGDSSSIITELNVYGVTSLPSSSSLPTLPALLTYANPEV